MKTSAIAIAVLFLSLQAISQIPKLYVQIVSHNEPSDSLQLPLNYQAAKNNIIHLADIVDSKNVKWNLQTSDGFVFGARQDEANTGTNVFETLAAAPYNDNIEIDPRSKNFPGRNIADQWYLLDSLNGNPSKTVGGFIYYVCPPGNSSLIDWWQYTDTVTGTFYGNKIKFNLLSGAGSLSPHCNDLNDFGIFKPDTTNNFYSHNPARNLWCIGTGCAPVLDSLDDEQAIIDLIQGQVDSIQNGLWPADKFYVTRIMTNQREYGPLFFQKIEKVIDSLNLIPGTQFKWATLTETFSDFQVWQTTSGLDYSQWLCGQTITGIDENPVRDNFLLFPNPSNGIYSIEFNDELTHKICVFNSIGSLINVSSIYKKGEINLTALAKGLYYIRIDQIDSGKLVKE